MLGHDVPPFLKPFIDKGSLFTIVFPKLAGIIHQHRFKARRQPFSHFDKRFVGIDGRRGSAQQASLFQLETSTVGESLFSILLKAHDQIVQPDGTYTPTLCKYRLEIKPSLAIDSISAGNGVPAVTPDLFNA